MTYFGQFFIDKEKDMVVELYLDKDTDVMSYVLRTPNHATGNLISNLARLCSLPLSEDESGLRIIRGTLPCYITSENRKLYVFRLLDTKVANIYPDGRIERKAFIPSISKTLMSQTKDYTLDFRRTVVKTYILQECKFETDLHTHMNANLSPDLLIALGIHHQIRYPLYYVRKLGLRLTQAQEEALLRQREQVALRFASSPLTGKYLDRKINDATFINFASLLLLAPEHIAYNLPRIRASLAILKDGQAVFTNLEKVYLYRYVFCKGVSSEDKIEISPLIERIGDADILSALRQMDADRMHPAFSHHTLFQDKLLWIARSYARCGIRYAEISDTTLVKADGAPEMLRLALAVLPAIEAETGVTLRFLAAIRRTPLTIVKDNIVSDTLRENLQVLSAIAEDPYVAGSDIIGEEINDIRELEPLLGEIVGLSRDIPGFTIRIHAGENDGLRDNVLNSLLCVRRALAPGQEMPALRIGHGLYTANLASPKGKQLMEALARDGVVLEFQISSNVRLNNLTTLTHHPLKTYLHHGVACVQGTDGGALYGTDSIDEELALEKLLNLSREELLQMRKAEKAVMDRALSAFAQKRAQFPDIQDIAGYYREKIEGQRILNSHLLAMEERLESASVLAPLVRELPTDRVPLIFLGGSFNQDTHRTVMRPQILEMIDHLLEQLSPQQVCFVIGPSLTGYEAYLLEHARGRFDCFAFVPSRITQRDADRLLRAEIPVRVSIEPSHLAIYKSFAYEIFKRRPSVLLALDGNTPAANMIQEARNGKRKCHIFVSAAARMLSAKARSLEGYANVFQVTAQGTEATVQAILDAVALRYPEKWLR
ncbi:MAG: adenosine deaminase [Clostridia bacterium]|nr:adenosine deaminase [Clostridia bacterium]MBR2288005.1 adenosine deaminase [Clostridia bacterium]